VARLEGSERELERVAQASAGCSSPQKSRRITIVRNIHPLVLVLIATTLEVSGDALVRMAIYKHVGLARIALVVAGGPTTTV
jgi:hypothetical protein